MTRGLQLSSANNILDLTSKRSALLTEKSNLEKSGHLNSPKNASYGQRLTQSKVYAVNLSLNWARGWEEGTS